MKAKDSVSAATPQLISFDQNRDAYGFAVRPQHVERYREYANIYKEEEVERSDRWKDFLERQAESTQFPINGSSAVNNFKDLPDEPINRELDSSSQNGAEVCDGLAENATEIKEVPTSANDKIRQVQIWSDIRPSLRAIEDMMSTRVKNKVGAVKREQDSSTPAEEAKRTKGEDSEDEYYDLERSDSLHDVPLNESPAQDVSSPKSLPPWKEELECLVQGGVPMALRGELWQAFVGVRARRVENYYQDLLSRETKSGNNSDHRSMELEDTDSTKELSADECAVEKWKAQIDKDLPRTFPGHPALDKNGRNALRRLLIAYARHNPSVGYCQAMNFFAGLLLLLMPEENAFWTLIGILDDCFDGYYSEEMIESQVDQRVLEELVREKFPKLVNHLDYLGVQVQWITGPWFLSVFMNVLPWESVLRVWDVLLFEGNRVMLFRTALALMDLYGPALVTTKDAGDAVTLLQSLAGSTFDSSQLVLTGCMGYQNVKEARLQELRNKYRSTVKAALEERSKCIKGWRDSQDLVPANVDEAYVSMNGNTKNSGTDLEEQVKWLKVELSKLLEEKKSAELRGEELETALMEMVKQDNRRQLSARAEQLEHDVAELKQALAHKQEEENAMLQVLMRVEQEQKETEDARRFAEQDAAAQRYAVQMLQDKYEEAMASLAEMEKRAVMAESILEATLQYQTGQSRAQSSPQPSPRTPKLGSPDAQTNEDASQEFQPRRVSLLSRPFGLGWRDRNKGSPGSADVKSDDKQERQDQSPRTEEEEIAQASPVQEKV
nr:ecotropic viral integration site 5 protein homolog isoform X1 [Ipomoea trifida]